MEGLLVWFVVINFVCQFIVFLYLLDNEILWMIIISVGLGCCIEFWKIGKVMYIEVLMVWIFYVYFYVVVIVRVLDVD